MYLETSISQRGERHTLYDINDSGKWSDNGDSAICFSPLLWIGRVHQLQHGMIAFDQAKLPVCAIFMYIGIKAITAYTAIHCHSYSWYNSTASSRLTA